MAPDTLTRDLGALVGSGNVLTGEDVANRTDGWPPVDPIQARCIVRPGSTAEVSAVLRLCDGAGVAVVPQGGRTGLVKGARSCAEDVALSLERLNRIEAIDPVGATMTVEAGVTLGTVQRAAEAAGLFYPVDIGARDSATIGGTIATNAGGHRVIRYGMTREQILGVEAVLADGTVVSSLNTLLKNNAAYDLKQLFIGSEGTLGVITRAVLRLRPPPGPTAVAFLGIGRFDHVLAVLRRLAEATRDALSSFEVMWSDFIDIALASGRYRPPLAGRHPFYALVEVAGSAAEAALETAINALWEAGIVSDAVIAKSEAQAAALWAIRGETTALDAALRPALNFDVGLPQTEMETYVDAVRHEMCARWSNARVAVFGHVGDSNLHLMVGVGRDDDDTRHAVEEIVYRPLRALRGSISAEHGIGLEKRAFLDVSRTREELELMRRLKAALDPRHTLNPGKVLG